MTCPPRTIRAKPDDGDWQPTAKATVASSAAWGIRRGFMARNYNRWIISVSNTVSAFLPRGTRTRGLFSPSDYAQMRAFFAARPELEPTPATALPDLAAELGLASLVVKDETARFGLNAFKLLGARFAIETLLSDGTLHARQTIVCPRGGNHGRAGARGAG